ncbi:MAG: SDR family NAD(P)-dependent oxidoreductase [Pseudomonadota bacterium]
MNKIDLEGEVAIITGGAQGIGFATADRLVKSGTKVCIFDIDQETADKAALQLGENCIAFQVNITDLANVEAACASVADQFGKISILVNSAGIAGINTTVDQYPVDEWQRIMDLNVNGMFYMNRSVVPFMKTNGYGRIVNIASVAGKEGNPNASAYSTSKAAVIGFTKSLGKELADLDIAVNCITPAAARTRIFDQMSEEHIAFMLSKIPRGRFVEVDEVAAMIAWLVCRENSFTTAGVFDLSGGRATY